MAIAVWIGVVFLVGVFYGFVVGVRDVLRRHRGRLLDPLVALKFLGLVSMLVGFTGFVGRMALSTGLGSRIPSYVEFPLEPDQTTFTDSKGTIYAPLVEIGRMQIYSPDRAFRGGWWFPTYGGSARVDLLDDSTLVVYTLKRQSLTEFDIRGKVRTLAYGAPTNTLTDAKHHADFTSRVSSSPVLLACTSFVGAWITGVGGLLLLLGAEKLQRRRKPRVQASREIQPRLAPQMPA